MLNKNDFKYILKRVIVFLIIALVVAFLGSCRAKADTFNPVSMIMYTTNNSALSNNNLTTIDNLTYNDSSFDIRRLMVVDYPYSSINQFAMVLNHNGAFSPPDTYYKFDLYLYGGNLVSNGTLNYDISSVKAWNAVTNTTVECDLNGGEIYTGGGVLGVHNFLQVHVRCVSPNINSFRIFLQKKNNSLSDVTLSIGIGLDPFYTTDITNASILAEINDVKQSMNDTVIWQQQTELNQQQFNDYINDINNENITNPVISQLILMPITFLQAFLNGFNGQCSNYNLGSLYGTNLVLPCINIQSFLGSTLWDIIDYLVSGMLIFAISKKFVNIFDDLTNLRTNQIDELYGGGA